MKLNTFKQDVLLYAMIAGLTALVATQGDK